jgi:hypothetical protein
MPSGEYATVEIVGRRTLVGRVTEVDRFGTKLLQVEPLFNGHMLAPVFVGGSSIYQFTSCDAATALRRQAKSQYDLPSAVFDTIAPELIPAAARSLGFHDFDDDDFEADGRAREAGL